MIGDTREVNIYVLSESDTGSIRYVGSTVDPTARLKGHLSTPTSARMAEWIGSVLKRGAEVDLLVIDTVQPGRDRALVERRWIRRVGRRLNILNGIWPGGHRQATRECGVMIDRRPPTDRMLRLPPHLAETLDRLASFLGTDRSSTIRLGIIELAERHGVQVSRPASDSHE